MDGIESAAINTDHGVADQAFALTPVPSREARAFKAIRPVR